MKKFLILLVALVFVLGATAAFAIDGPHNFNDRYAPYQGTKSACMFCHLPHGGSTNTTGLPLWARKNAVTTFQVYGGGATISGSTVGQPGAFSLACLSCHDGATAMNTVYKNGTALNYSLNGTTTPTTIYNLSGGSYNPVIGNDSNRTGNNDLRNDHPVGVVYNSSASYAGLSSSVTQIGSSSNYLVNGKFIIFGGGDGTGTLECGSCHDPHNYNATGETFTDGETGMTGNNGGVGGKYLRAPVSSICTDCHSRK